MKKIDLMHSMFGKLKDQKCKDCAHLCVYEANRRWFKCDVYGLSNSVATDWAKSYPACGMFNKCTSYTDVYKLAKEERSEIADGQISLFEVE